MKNLTKYLNENLTTSTIMCEGRIKNMSDTQWLTSRYCSGYGTYIQTVYDPVQTHAMYGIPTSEVNYYKDLLKRNKGISRFRVVRANSKAYSIICFKYDAAKDNDRIEAANGEAERERKEAEQFEADVKAVNTSKYNADPKHIAKMKAYFNKHSDPERLVKSIKDNEKLIGRWIAAIVIDWPEAISAFSAEIERRRLLSKAELVAYSERFKSEKVDDSDMNRLNPAEKKLSESWITKSVYKFLSSLEGYTIEWIESFKNAKTREGKNAMSRNGRAWTEGFVIKITNDGTSKSKEITFDIITNEGGGLYGYAIQGGFSQMTLKEFKERITRELP